MQIHKDTKHHTNAKTLFVRIVAFICAVLIMGSALVAAFC